MPITSKIISADPRAEKCNVINISDAMSLLTLILAKTK
jgi:hypothetical protein